MKHLNSHPQSLNGVKSSPNGGKEKRKTIYIKLPPKPNAPRYLGIKMQSPGFPSQ